MEKNTSVKGIYIFRIIMSTILAMLFFVLIIGEANAQSCPFSQQANRKIIYFPDPGPIVSNEDIAHATRAVAVPLTGPFRANISLYAYDSYPARYSMSQPNERYFIQFRSGGTVVASSHSTSDLADYVVFAQITQTVNYDLNVPSSIDNIVAVHAVYPDTSSPNSHHPVCAAIDIIPNPTCSASFSPTSLTAPGTSNLSWSSANADRIVGSCTGPIPVAAGDQALNYSNFPVSFTASQTGIETCTFIPYEGSVQGTACSASVVVSAPLPSPSCSASFSPTSLTAPGTSNLSWSSANADTLVGSCTGPILVAGGNQDLNHTNFPFSFSSSQTGTETCTFIPSQNGTNGTACSASVVVNTSSIPTLIASCSATPSSADIGSPITWSSSASGGTGSYAYSWAGTDSLSGSNSSVSKSYSSAGSKIATITVISGTQSATANCSATVVTPNANLAASCSATPSSANIGDSIAWNATASGGTGNYTYSWAGTDSLSGSNSSVSKSYSTAGSKSATVTVTSGTQSTTANCSATVVTPNANLVASCSANPSSVNTGGTITWNSSASGGIGSYTYSWSGTDSLSGSNSSTSKSYSTAGSKTATVTVTSGTETVTANCSATVVTPGTNLTASCSANPSSTSIGNIIVWSSVVSGGTGSYTYSWSGTDSLSGASSSVSQTCSSAGTKNASVTVTSGTNTVVANCSATVTGGGGGGPIVCTANCGGGGPAIYYSNSLSGYCEGIPSNGKVGDQVIWNVYPSGGTGSYSFNWYGSDGATGYGYSVLKTYSTPGAKTMSVNIWSGGESISRTCSVSVGQVLAYVSPSLTSVYLSEVPYTGLGDIDSIWFFVMGLSLWSGGMAYFMQKRKTKLQPQNISTTGRTSDKDEVKPTIISQNEIYESAIRTVEDYARENNAIISSDAVKSITKNCLLHNGRIDLATKEVIIGARNAQGITSSEWIAIGEKDL